MKPLKSRSLWPWLLLGLAAAVAWTALPAKGGADLALYRRMASLALTGRDPYLDPYADFPPLKMLLLELLGRWDLWAIFRTLAFSSVLVAALVFVHRRDGSASAKCAVMALAFQPLIFHNWIALFEDKTIYPALLLASMCLIQEPAWPTRKGPVLIVSILLGVLAGYSGVLVLLVPLLLLQLWRYHRSIRTLLMPGIVSLGIFSASHLLYFSGWTLGYAHRWARQASSLPAHHSLFVPLQSIGLYHPLLPTAAAAAIVLGAYALAFRSDSRHRPLLLAYWACLALGPDASLDRIMAACFPLMVELTDRPLLTSSIIVAMLVAYTRAEAAAGPAAVITVWFPALLTVIAFIARATRSGRDADISTHGVPQ